MRIFLSHYSDEQSFAEDIADHLKKVFRNQSIETFLASSWDSLAPGDTWEEKLIDALKNADALVVLMSIDALGRAWLNFELGVAWALKKRILIFCHKGMSRSALPRPYSSLQSVDITDLRHNEKLDTVAKAVASTLDLRLPTAMPASEALEPIRPHTFTSTYRSWSLRPAFHIGATTKGRFLIGAVYPARPDRAEAANLEPGKTLYVRLFVGPVPEGRYIAALVTGDIASFFEKVTRDTVQIDAEIRLAAAYDDGENTIPIIVVDSYQQVLSKT